MYSHRPLLISYEIQAALLQYHLRPHVLHAQRRIALHAFTGPIRRSRPFTQIVHSPRIVPSFLANFSLAHVITLLDASPSRLPSFLPHTIPQFILASQKDFRLTNDDTGLVPLSPASLWSPTHRLHLAPSLSCLFYSAPLSFPLRCSFFWLFSPLCLPSSSP